VSRTTQSSPNKLTVTSADGTAIGTLVASVMGVIAFTAAGRSLGGYGSIDAAIAALENAAARHERAS
jgi:hypothetical protein